MLQFADTIHGLPWSVVPFRPRAEHLSYLILARNTAAEA